MSGTRTARSGSTAVLLRGATRGDLWPEIWPLLALSVLRFRKRLD